MIAWIQFSNDLFGSKGKIFLFFYFVFNQSFFQMKKCFYTDTLGSSWALWAHMGHKIWAQGRALLLQKNRAFLIEHTWVLCELPKKEYCSKNYFYPLKYGLLQLSLIIFSDFSKFLIWRVQLYIIANHIFHRTCDVFFLP